MFQIIGRIESASLSNDLMDLLVIYFVFDRDKVKNYTVVLFLNEFFVYSRMSLENSCARYGKCV